MKKKNVYEKRIKAQNDAAQIFCWCIVIALNQEEGIGSERLGRACDEMKTFEDKFKNMIRSSGRKAASVEMERLLDGVCDTDIILPSLKYPKTRFEEQIRMAENDGGRIAWLVMACSARSTFGFGKDRLARLKKESLDNYRQYIEWKESAGETYALEQIRRCASAALRETLYISDTRNDEPPTRAYVRENDPISALNVSSTVSANLARKNGVKNIPILVLSQNEAQKQVKNVLDSIYPQAGEKQ